MGWLENYEGFYNSVFGLAVDMYQLFLISWAIISWFLRDIYFLKSIE